MKKKFLFPLLTMGLLALAAVVAQDNLTLPLRYPLGYNVRASAQLDTNNPTSFIARFGSDYRSGQYALEWSTNLIDWVALGTTTLIADGYVEYIIVDQDWK